LSECLLLTYIPDTLVDLKELEIINCPLLTFIPSTIINLRELTCSYCPLLYLPFKYRQAKEKTNSNMLRIRIWQRRKRKQVYRKLINESSLHSISTVILDYV
jgi:hypothetical protein